MANRMACQAVFIVATGGKLSFKPDNGSAKASVNWNKRAIINVCLHPVDACPKYNSQEIQNRATDLSGPASAYFKLRANNSGRSDLQE